MSAESSPGLEFAACTDRGRVRERNEDALAMRPDRGWAVLADGMGGHRGGETAAQVSVTAALRRLDAVLGAGADLLAAQSGVAEAVAEANADVRRVGVERPELAGLGATLVVAVFAGGWVVCAHIGDSRMYRLSNGRLERLTRDHTVLQAQIDGGMMSAEEARRSCWRGVLTRGIGVDAVAQPDVATHSAQPGDVFLLCSDGLTDMLGDAEIAEVLAGKASTEASAGRLVNLANQRGGRDNVSVIVVRVGA